MSDVEEVILQQDPYGPARDTSALLRGYGGFRSRLQAIGLCCFCVRGDCMPLLFLLLFAQQCASSRLAVCCFSSPCGGSTVHTCAEMAAGQRTPGSNNRTNASYQTT